LIYHIYEYDNRYGECVVKFLFVMEGNMIKNKGYRQQG